MLDQSLLQSHFIGRDGFRWWVGQIPPFSSMSAQTDGCGWGNRFKVRILGYHPSTETELSNDDLPWAQVMLPTTAGTGAANYAVNPKLRPGDIVIGFFLDGDNAQVPIIMGALGRTSQVKNSPYTAPFIPFTGYTNNITKPNGRLWPDESNESQLESQISPRQVSPETIQKLNQSRAQKKEISAYTGIGKEIVFADTCEDTSIKTIKSEINNLLKFIQQAQATVSEYQQKVESVVEVITSSISWVVGKMFDYLYNFLVGDDKNPGIIPKGLKALYDSVFGATLAATGNPGVAHQAGVASNEAFIIPVKILEEAIPCVAAKVINLLKTIIRNLLNSLLDNIEQFVTCAAEQFVGTLLNSIVNQIANGLSSALDGVSSLLGAAFNVVDILQSTVDAIKSLGGLFDCNQDKGKCSGLTKEWIIGKGPKDTLNADQVFDNIYNSMNNISGSLNDLASNINGVTQSAQGVADAINNFDPAAAFNSALSAAESCFTGFPTSCNPPYINIFGGGGSGATAIPIFGAVQQLETAVNNVVSSASIIGAYITNGGSGYTSPPYIEFIDNCNLGFGAVAQSAINTNGEVTSIYIVSPGENYPLGDQDTYIVNDVYVQSPGSDYSTGDTATDNLGNQYELVVDNGSIISAKPININEVTDLPIIQIQSETGTGAILRPIFAPMPENMQREPKEQIDCVL